MSDQDPQQHPKNARFSVISEVWSADVRFDGAIEYVEEYGGNKSESSWQTIFGAPVENQSPFGYHVGGFTALFLNIGQMVGTGIFSTPANVLQGVGSVGLSLVFWAIGLLIAGIQLSVYLELASYFPNRSGGQVVYLEQAYPRPRYLIPIAFAVQALMLSFASGNAVVMAEYLYAAAGHESTAWQQKGLAVAGMTVIAMMVIFSTKVSYRISNAITIMKVVVLLFISITGLVVLAGHSNVSKPHANFEHSFSGTSKNGWGISNALIQINFTYFGYTNAFNVVNEIKNPIKTLKKAAPTSLLIVGILYILVNIAYFAAIPSSTLKTSPELASTLFLTTVFPTTSALRVSKFLFSLFAFGTILSTLITSSRIIRECARQGVIPFPGPLSATGPFCTPLNVYTVQYILTIIMILAPPAGDAFNFVADLKSYPAAIFALLTTAGLLSIRMKRKRMGLGFTEGKEGFKAWDVAIWLSLAVNGFMCFTPWVPPHLYNSAPDVSFWYGTSILTGLAVLVLCGIYWLGWKVIGSKIWGYKIRNELLLQEDELVKAHRLVTVPNHEVEMWHAEHDARGKKLDGAAPLGHVLLDQLDFNDLNNWTKFKPGG